MKLYNIVVERDFFSNDFFYHGQDCGQISNLVDDIIITRNIKNIIFSYCNTIANNLADRIVMEAFIVLCKDIQFSFQLRI